MTEPLSPDIERKLVLAAQRGDEDAFAQLYDTYVDRIYRYIAYRVNNTEVARDLTGEVFLRVVEGLPTYEPRTSPFLAWIYRIAHARVIDYYRTTNIRRETIDFDSLNVQAEDQNPEESTIQAIDEAEVRKAIANLSPDQQQVIIWRYIEGYNLQETATLIGKTVGAVKVIQHRAVQVLAKLLRKK